jgi:phage nucleotide-binding protein
MEIKSTNTVSIKRATILITGVSGSGKTFLARSLPEKEVLIISLESGLMSLMGTNISVIEVKNKKELDEVMKFLGSSENKFKYIFFDSLSELGELLLFELKQDPKFQDPRNTLQLYGKYNEQITSYIKYVRDLPQNVILTCLEANTTDGLEKVVTFHLPGSAIKNSLKSFIDICLHLKIFEGDDKKKVRKLVTSSEESVISKDRSGKLRAYEDVDLHNLFNKILGEKS